MFDDKLMIEALKLAQKACELNEVPVGCVIYDHDQKQIISSSYNQIQYLNNPNAHAEMLAIESACKNKHSKYLFNCDIYVTLEPCVMCASAIANAKIKRLYYGASDPKGGAVENNLRYFNSKCCLHRPEIYTNITQSESSGLLKSFFRNLRNNKL